MAYMKKKELKELAETLRFFKSIEGQLQLLYGIKNIPKNERDSLNKDEILTPAKKLGKDEANLSIRFRVLERDGFKCVYCGRSPHKDNDVELQVDHVFPRSKGGDDTIENLVTSCFECKQGKKDYVIQRRKERNR